MKAYFFVQRYAKMNVISNDKNDKEAKITIK